MTERRRNAVWAAFVLVLAASWFFLLRPVSLGGPSGYVTIRGVSMLPTYHFGDLVVTHKQASYGKGDIVAYKVPKGQFGGGIVVIHRITGGDGATGFTLRGDNNNFYDDWHPKQENIVGKAWLHVPAVGLVLSFLHAPVPMASLAAGIGVALYLVPREEKRKPDVIALDAYERTVLTLRSSRDLAA